MTPAPEPSQPLVVLPTYQEALNIDIVLRRIREAVPLASVLVVDDSSPDGTADRASVIGEELGRIEVLRRPRKRGLGSAYREGFALGIDRGYDTFVAMDADLSHDPGALPFLLDALAPGVDLVVGSRYISGGDVSGWAAHRVALSRWGNRYAATMLRMDATDLTSGFRVYRASTLELVDIAGSRASGYGFQIEMAYRIVAGGGKLVEVPITFADRLRGRSKMSSRIVAEALLLVTLWGLRDLAVTLFPKPRVGVRATSAAPPGVEGVQGPASVPDDASISADHKVWDGPPS